jgi:hypothetical protein
MPFRPRGQGAEHVGPDIVAHHPQGASRAMSGLDRTAKRLRVGFLVAERGRREYGAEIVTYPERPHDAWQFRHMAREPRCGGGRQAQLPECSRQQ